MSDDIPAAPKHNDYAPNEIILYGVRLNESADFAQFHIEGGDNRRLQLAVLQAGVVVPKTRVSIAVIYGYAFEGHCYRLDKSKIVAFEPARGPEQANGCGFDGNYKMWRIAPKSMLLELSVNVDTADSIVLEANLPGNRPPNTYGNNMQLAHRGGRISKPGG